MSYYTKIKVCIDFSSEEDFEKLNKFMQTKGFYNLEDYLDKERFDDIDAGKTSISASFYGNYIDQDEKIAELVNESGVKSVFCIRCEGEKDDIWQISNASGNTINERAVFISEESSKTIYNSLTAQQKRELKELLCSE